MSTIRITPPTGGAVKRTRTGSEPSDELERAACRDVLVEFMAATLDEGRNPGSAGIPALRRRSRMAPAHLPAHVPDLERAHDVDDPGRHRPDADEDQQGVG